MNNYSLEQVRKQICLDTSTSSGFNLYHYQRSTVEIIQSRVRGNLARSAFKQRKSSPLQVIFALGGPGSGRRSLGEIVIDGQLGPTLGIIRLSIITLLRDAMRHKHKDADTIRIAMEDGEMVSLSIVLSLLKQAIRKTRFQRHGARNGTTIVIDNFPMTAAQKSAWEESATEFPACDNVFVFECDEDVMMRRCAALATEHCEYEDESVVATMMARFKQQCGPVIDLFKKAGCVTVIRTDGAIEDSAEKFSSNLREITQEWEKQIMQGGEISDPGHTRPRLDWKGELPWPTICCAVAAPDECLTSWYAT